MNKHKPILLNFMAVVLALSWLVPLVWMIGTAFTEGSYTMSLIPQTRPTLENLCYVWNAVPFGRYYLNTIIVVAGTFSVQFITVTMAAYALAVLKFKGEKLIFIIIFIQLIIPRSEERRGG